MIRKPPTLQQLKNLKPRRKGMPSLNPLGRPPDALNAAMKKLTKAELEDIANIIIKGDVQKLKEIVKDDSQTVIRVLVASVVLETIKKGDHEGLEKILNRLIGKVKDHVQVDGAMPVANVIIAIPNNNRDTNNN